MSSTTSQIKAVRAGAGAGKTYNLTHQVLDFALQFKSEKGEWPRVLVTTFTRKATQELSERLIKLAMTEKPEALDFMSSSQYLSVSTIHGILDRFLKQQGHHLLLQSDFGYMKPSEASFVAKKSLRELALKNSAYKSLFTVYSFSQLRSLLLQSMDFDLDEFSPITKKDLDALLSEHLAFVQRKVDTWLKASAGLTAPTEKIRLMWSKIGSISSQLTLDQWSKNRSATLALLDEIDLKGVKVKEDSDCYQVHESFKELLKELRTLDKSYFDASTFDYLESINQQFALLRADFKEKIDQYKKVANKIEISDLEIFSLKLIKQFPESARAFAQDIDYWLIDEFQDTSPRQIFILERLIGSKPFYLVGDPQQSIYLFRGARSEVFRDKVNQVIKRGGVLDILDTNYRSTPRLLNFINHLSRLLGSAFEPMKTAFEIEGESPSVADIVIVEPPAKDEAIDDSYVEMEVIAQKMFQLSHSGVAFEQMAVLVRTNDQLEKLGAFLNQKGFPVHLHSSGLFWNRREVQDAVALLKFLLNPFDDLNLVKLLRSPMVALSDKSLAELMTSRQSSIWECVRKPFDEGLYGGPAQRLVEYLSYTSKLGTVVAFERALEGLGFFDLHRHFDPSGRAEGNLWKFIHLLKNFERERGAHLVRFVNEAERPEHMDKTVDAPGSVEPNKINIMTVHASKGLQFDYVFLPFLDKKPHVRKFKDFSVDELKHRWSVRAPSSDDEQKNSSSLFEKKMLAEIEQRQQEEDLRVFYVAYTRAKKHITLSWSNPVDETSWAYLLRDLNLEPGCHELQDCTYNVERMSEPAPQENRMVTESAPKVPAMFMGERHQRWGDVEQIAPSVTQLLTSGYLIKKNYKNSFIKKNQGILFHKLLELMKYPTSKDFSGLVEQWFPGQEEEVGEALNYALQLQQPPLVDLIKSGFVEWSFRAHKKDRDIEGQIDLWGIHQNQLWLVDYKSGEKVLKDKAFKQLTIYASAVQDYLKWEDEIHLAVVYPFVKESFTEVITKKDFIF